MTKPVTQRRLYNITLFYLTKFDASSEKVRQMLRRRLYKASLAEEPVPTQANEWIEEIIQKMTDLGYINDNRYAENQTRQLSLQGKSESFIINKLRQDGISPEQTRHLLENREEDDFTRAVIWLKRHKKGPFRSKDNDSFYTKDLAALGRAGFSYETACAALKSEERTD